MKGAIKMLLNSKLFSKENNQSAKVRKENSAVLPIKVDGKVVLFA